MGARGHTVATLFPRFARAVVAVQVGAGGISVPTLCPLSCARGGNSAGGRRWEQVVSVCPRCAHFPARAVGTVQVVRGGRRWDQVGSVCPCCDQVGSVCPRCAPGPHLSARAPRWLSVFRRRWRVAMVIGSEQHSNAVFQKKIVEGLVFQRF